MTLNEEIQELLERVDPTGPINLEVYESALWLTYFDLIHLLISNLLSGEYLRSKYPQEIQESFEFIISFFEKLNSKNKGMKVLNDYYSNQLITHLVSHSKFLMQIQPTDPEKVVLGKDVYMLFHSISYKATPIIEPDLKHAISTYDNFLQIAHTVALYDHKLAASPDVLTELYTIATEVRFYLNVFSNNKNSTKKYDRIKKSKFLWRLLNDKTQYLIGLISKINKNDGISYIFNNGVSAEEISIDPKFEFEPVRVKFSENEHMMADEKTLIQEARNSKLERRFLSGDELSLYELRILARIININGSPINHEELLDFLSKLEQDENEISSYDSDTYKVMTLYLQNNKLSNLIESGTPFEELIAQVMEIKRLNLQCGVHNYYTDIKLCESLLKNFNKTLTNYEQDKQYINHLEHILEQFRLYLGKLETNFQWSRTNCFVPFRELKRNCTLSISDNENTQDLFIASAYSSPINYSIIGDKVSGLQSLPVMLEQQLQNSKNLLQYRAEVIELKSVLNASEKKQIEILSIFAAIVLFVSGNIQIFTKVETVTQGLHFMFIFALSLSIFVVLMWALFRNKSESINMIQVFIIVLFVLAIGLGIYSFGPDTPLPEFDFRFGNLF